MTPITDKEVKDRAYKIDPAAFTSYSGRARRDAQSAALALAWSQLEYEARIAPAAIARVVEAIQPQPRYSVCEIDRMRKAISRNPRNRLPGYHRYGDFKPQDVERHTEELLRTFMINGTTPVELEAEADAEWERIRERRAIRSNIGREREHQAQIFSAGKKTYAELWAETTAEASNERKASQFAGKPSEIKDPVIEAAVDVVAGVPVNSFWRRTLITRIEFALRKITGKL